ncbi:ABC transporter substrate-binding protein [Robinsoniella peoriensis]|uniref:ABC transporter substrate-binding protein n=1 Tax=Robinsoniella peoriensis TaxID=180332 RepID=UPI0005C7DEC3|nr:ABC transporter substrate-binding protein [Robinsoniella peoriensis]
MRGLKKLMVFTLAAVIAASAAGCGSSQGKAEADNTTVTEAGQTGESAAAEADSQNAGAEADSQNAGAEAEKTSAAGGTVKVSVGSEPDNLDPMLSSATDTSAIMMNVFEGLLGFNEKGEFIPALSETYDISEDGLTYSFKLKQGIKFHDGADFTSKDVKYTYEKLAGLNGEAPLNETLNQLLASVETPDDYSVNLILKEKNAGFLSKATISIVEKDYTQNSTKPVGTGPFKFVEYIQGQKVILEKYPEYSTIKERMPVIDKVEFKIMTDANARLMGLKSGDLDITSVDAKNVEALKNDYNIVQGPQNMVQLMALNNSVEPFNDVKVRQAINYAVNKEEIINTVVNGNGTKVDSFLSPSMSTYFNTDLKNCYNTDIEKAKTLLKEAGYENGFKMTITVPSNYQTHVDTAQVIKNQLSKIGIEADIQLIEWAQWLDTVYGKANYEATIIGHSGKLDPNDFLNRFDSAYDKNYFKFSDPQYDELIHQAAVSTDEAKRVELFKECQQLLVDQAAAVYIQDPDVIYATSKSVQGMKNYPVTFLDMSSISLTK